jgi:tRNA pseudouridine55 synthase
MDGLILVDKPRGPTSHDIVARIRRCLGIQKVGHFGTLDPLATGLLLVAVGRAVKLFPLFSKHDKVYTGEILLGVATDTYDALGQPAAPAAGVMPRREAVSEAMRSFEGEILQAPPPYSAKKLAGKPLYKWARSRKPVAAPPRPVVVRAFKLADYRPPVIEFEVRCSSGTYVRSLAHALGEKLGCGAHLAGLRRLSSGELSLAQALPLERVEDLIAAGRAQEAVLPLESLLPGLPKLILTPTGEARLQKGRALAAGDTQVTVPGVAPAGAGPAVAREPVRLFSLAGRFLGLAQPGPEPDTFVPFLVFVP